MSAQNGPGSQGPNRPGPWRPQPPQAQAPVNPSPPPAQAMPQSGQVPPQQVPPQQSDERCRPRPQQQQGRRPSPGGQPMQGQPRLPAQPPMQRQALLSARVYAQPRFAPTVTQEMRMRAGIQAPPQMVTETPWTGAVRQTQPQTGPGSTENIIRLAIGIDVLVALFGGLLLMAMLGRLSYALR